MPWKKKEISCIVRKMFFAQQLDIKARNLPSRRLQTKKFTWHGDTQEFGSLKFVFSSVVERDPLSQKHCSQNLFNGLSYVPVVLAWRESARRLIYKNSITGLFLPRKKTQTETYKLFGDTLQFINSSVIYVTIIVNTIFNGEFCFDKIFAWRHFSDYRFLTKCCLETFVTK